MQYTKGERVRHPTVSEWGIGVVMADSSQDFVRIYFATAGEKKLSLRHVEPIRIADQEAVSADFACPKPHFSNKEGCSLCLNCGQATTFGERADPHRVELGWCEPCFRQRQRTLLPKDRRPKTGELFAQSIPEVQTDNAISKATSHSELPQAAPRKAGQLPLESTTDRPASFALRTAILPTTQPNSIPCEQVDPKPAPPQAVMPKSTAAKVGKAKPTPTTIYFIALDFETTGRSPRDDAIIEIGAVKFDIDGNILGEFTELANPGRSIPYYASRIHGITDRDLARCDPVKTVWERFLNWAGSFAALVAHSAQFERGFINALYSGNPPQFEYICSLQLARKIYPRSEDHKLVTVCDYIGYQIQNAHRALPDARATAHLLAEMIRCDPSIISKFVMTAAMTHKVAAVPPQTERLATDTGRNVPTAAPIPSAVSARTGLKSDETRECQSPPEPKSKSLHGRTGEAPPQRASRPIQTARARPYSGALTEVEERVLIEAGEARARRLADEELSRKREADENARVAAEAERRNPLARSVERPPCNITRRDLADGRVSRGSFSEGSRTGKATSQREPLANTSGIADSKPCQTQKNCSEPTSVEPSATTDNSGIPKKTDYYWVGYWVCVAFVFVINVAQEGFIGALVLALLISFVWPLVVIWAVLFLIFSAR